MKFLLALSVLAASALATPVELSPRQRGEFSRYELRIASGAADTPFAGGAVSIKNGKLGFFGDDGAGVFVDVDESSQVSNSVRITIDGEDDLESYVSLDGSEKDGLRGVVVSDRPSKGALFRFGAVDDDGYAKITREGGGKWVVESVRDDDYELLWWDGEGYTLAITFPVELVGRLTAQSRKTRD